MRTSPKPRLSSWAQLRFSIIGGLLARPPKTGELCERLEILASRSYRHPTKNTLVTFGTSTIERWYYNALKSTDPIDALARKPRSDAGENRAMSSALLSELGRQYRNFSNWSYKLHSDNLIALVEEQPELGDAPSYSTVQRRMKERGWYKKSSIRNKTKGQKLADERLEQREVRSFDCSHVHGLWHLDFHKGRLRVVDSHGEWHTPIALCVLDDRSRLCCHIQWYLNETTEVLQHGLTQAFAKRGLPRSLMTDNGSAMLSHEIKNGLLSLSVQHNRTLPYSPYQNGKQESFWGQLEGRLVSMLARVETLDLNFLNSATQAWVEMEYNRCRHEEINCTPVSRLQKDPDGSRPSVSSKEMEFAFTLLETRAQRRSDGTLQIKGVRFEVPSRFRHLTRLHVRYRSWDLSRAWLVDERTNDLLADIYPLDKIKNSSGFRRTLTPLPDDHYSADTDADPLPPLLRKLMAEYVATGVPPAYIPIENNKPATEEAKDE